LREIANNRKVELRIHIKEKKKQEREPKRIRNEVFKTIEAIYIEPLTSRPPPTF